MLKKVAFRFFNWHHKWCISGTKVWKSVELFVQIMGYGGRRGTRLAEWGVGVIYRHAETLHMGYLSV